MARIHKINTSENRKDREKVLNLEDNKINLVIMDMNKIFLYSLRKINVKAPEPNSVLYPLTSSLSLSLKSYGVRFKSAKIEGIHRNKTMGIKMPGAIILKNIKLLKLYLPIAYTKHNKHK